MYDWDLEKGGKKVPCEKHTRSALAVVVILRETPPFHPHALTCPYCLPHVQELQDSPGLSSRQEFLLFHYLHSIFTHMDENSEPRSDRHSPL